jgi:hypothetical protein
LDPKNLEKLQKFRERGDRRGEMLPKLKKSKLGSLLGVVCSIILPKCDAALQNQQAKACWKCCKTPRKVTEIFCVNTENFQPTKVIDEIYL